MHKYFEIPGFCADKLTHSDSFFLQIMGCEVYEDVVHAASSAEAIRLYQEKAPTGFYDDQAYCITRVRVFEEEFQSKEDGFRFLQSRMKKWDMEAGMVKCGDNQYAYYVMLPC